MVRPENYDSSLNSRNIDTGSDFFTFKARLKFTELRQAFIKALIFYYFDLKCHILIESNASGYSIYGILSHLTLHDLGQCYLIAFISSKMIPIKIRYETHNGKFSGIIEVFKT